MRLVDIPSELGHPLKVHSKGLGLSLDAETDEKLEEPYAAPEEGTDVYVRPSLEVTDSRVWPSFGLHLNLEDLDNSPAFVKGKSPSHGPQKPVTVDSSSASADCEPLPGPHLLRAAHFVVESCGSRPVDSGPPSAPRWHIAASAGLDRRLVDCEPLSGPKFVLRFGHVGERWGLDLDYELDGEDGVRTQVDCEPPVDPNLLLAVDDTGEPAEWPAAVQHGAERDEELDGS